MKLKTENKIRVETHMTDRTGNLLIRAGIITPDQLNEGLQEQERNGGRLGSVLLKLGFINESTLVSFLSQQFGLPGVDLSKTEIQPSIIELVPAEIARRYQVIPLDRRGKALTIAASDPSDTSALDDIRFVTGYSIRVNIASEGSIQKALDKYYPWGAVSNPLEVLEEEEEKIEYVKDEEDIGISALKDAIHEAPVVRFVNATLMDAVRKHASDIHVESYEKVLRIRYRLDGVLHEVMNNPFPSRLKSAIISRLKIMAELDIAERRLPQDGHIRLRLGGGHDVDLRISVLPTIFGEKVVLRLSDRSLLKMDMTKLGFEKEILEQFNEAIHKPYGMVLVTGPTGSGKSTTLYSALSELNQPGVNISTVEDPVEVDVPGINQVHIHEGIGLTFAACLRSFLRQDPDIIMVGEIRDLETVQIAIRAALTGHLVLSTLHTNDAPSTVTRLLDMDVEPFLAASSINLIVAQRLIRKICLNCKEELKIPPQVLMDLGVPQGMESFTCYKGAGCDTCSNIGYKGRIALYEVMPMHEELKELILRRASAFEVKQEAIKLNMKTLRQSGITKIREGITTIDEVLKATTSDER